MSSLILAIIVAFSDSLAVFPNGEYCAQSFYALGDILPAHKAGAYVIGISKILNKAVPVGFVYTLNNGEQYAQGLRNMPKRDRDRIGIKIEGASTLSNLAAIKTNPWSTLTISPCLAHEYHKKMDRSTYF